MGLEPPNTELHTGKATHDNAAYHGRTHPILDYLVIIVRVRLSEAPFKLIKPPSLAFQRAICVHIQEGLEALLTYMKTV